MTRAYVNHGRWVAECDTPYCAGAEAARGARIICDNCGQPSTVTYPRHRARIDEVLAQRLVPQTRNWVPGETVRDLLEENKAYGVDRS